jgi:hypothetical protein
MKGMLQGLQVTEDQIGMVEQARAGHPKAEDYKAIAPEENSAIPMKQEANPQKKPFRVTECEGLVRPEPPEVMKKPSRWQKLLHQITFHSKNSYVSQYKAYQRTLPERIEAYKDTLQEYHRDLEALERGENPRGLREAYKRAVEQAERRFGPTEKKAEAPKAQQEPAKVGAKPASRETVQRLENALLDTLFEGVIPVKETKEEQANLREEFRGHIQGTKGYQRMIQSGDGNIAKILEDPEKMSLVLADVVNGIMEKMNPHEKAPTNDAPQRSNEMEVQPKEIGIRM